jgi:hypothetical protein
VRKTRVDSKLGNLPAATQQEILRLSYEKTLEELQSHLAMPEDEGGLGIGHVSTGSLSTFLKPLRLADFRSRIHQSATDAKSVVDDVVRESAEDINTALLAGWQEWAFDMLVQRKIDSDTIKKVVEMGLKSRKQDLDERKIALLERKAGAADQVAAIVRNDALSDAEVRQRTVQIVDEVLLGGGKK